MGAGENVHECTADKRRAPATCTAVVIGQVSIHSVVVAWTRAWEAEEGARIAQSSKATTNGYPLNLIIPSNSSAIIAGGLD